MPENSRLDDAIAKCEQVMRRLIKHENAVQQEHDMLVRSAMKTRDRAITMIESMRDAIMRSKGEEREHAETAYLEAVRYRARADAVLAILGQLARSRYK